MDFELRPDVEKVKDLCRQFAEQAIKPRIGDYETRHAFPYELIRQMAELGLMGLMIPEAYGGLGADVTTYVAAMEEISRGDVTLGATWGAHMTLGCAPIYLFGSEEQKRKYLPPLAAGERLGAFALTEAGAGSDAAGIATRARLEGDHWIVNGAKCFITNTGTDISYGAVFLVVTDETRDGKKEFSNLIIERGTPGYTVGPNYHKIGWHSSDTREQILVDCRVPRENLLGERGAGLRQFLEVLDIGRIGFAATSLGLAQACLELALDHARQRVAFGRPISKYQLIQAKLAEVATELEMARLLTYKAAWLRDHGKPFKKEAAMAKWKASALAMRAADTAVQVHGGYGYIEECLAARYFRNAKILEIGEGTNEINMLVVAREIGC